MGVDEKVYEPTEPTRAKMDEFLRLYVEDPEVYGNIAKCMKKLNVPRQHFADRWMKNPTFAAEYEDARALFAGEVSVTFHKLALGQLGKVNPHALIALERKLNREEYQREPQGSGGLTVVVNMPGLSGGDGTPALPPVMDEGVLEAKGFLIQPPALAERNGQSFVTDDEEWTLDE